METRKYYSPDDIDKILSKEKNVFFIGIGGISMSSLATISKENGIKVGGSDRSDSELVKRLTAQGIDTHIGHSEENASGYTAFVYNAAIKDTNPEYSYAKANGYDLIYRSDYLGYLTKNYKNSIGVAGTHGKSTTTAMISLMLLEAQKDPTILNGAVIPEIDSAYRHGSEDYLAFEACEYKDSFLSFFPTIAVVLNVELDHIDYFSGIDAIIASFKKYVERTNNGYAVVNFDCENARKTVDCFGGKVVSYGIESADAIVRAENIDFKNGFAEFDVYIKEEKFTHINLRVSGKHNIMNSLAAICVAYILGISADVVKKSLEKFRGAKRRMEYKGILNGAKIYDDYAHHPTEVKTTLEGAKTMCKGKLYCVFQPHTYTRTKQFFDEFTKSFAVCNKVIFADIYSAREKDTLGMSAELLAEKTKNGSYVGDFDMIIQYLKKTVENGDTVVIMGAGDVCSICDRLCLEK